MVASIRKKVKIPIDQGVAEFVTFSGLVDQKEHIAIVFGDYQNQDTVLVRIHSECLTGDIFGSARCDCGEQLNEALSKMSQTGGILLYLRQEGRGIGLYHKIDAYSLQDTGMDTFDANTELGLAEDDREYTVAAQMLQALNVKSIRLLSNNPDKEKQLKDHGVNVIERLNTQVFAKAENLNYLLAKARRGGHSINVNLIKVLEEA